MIIAKKKDKKLVQRYDVQKNSKKPEGEREIKPMVFNKRQNPLSFVVDWQMTD